MEIITASTPLLSEISDRLTIGLCQMAPVWLNKKATLDKTASNIALAADQGCQLISFGEALIPGYPFWLERTDGARFNNQRQKEIHALYIDQGVRVEEHDLDDICKIAKDRKIAVYLGVMERVRDRGDHTLYCSLVYIDQSGTIRSVHRKLQPTYEERLVWGPGDGHGLQVHDLGKFRVGGLNCWENWMPLTRAALYAQGESLHVSVWPGGHHNTKDLPQVLAQESRSYQAAVCGLMRPSDVARDMPYAEDILKDTSPFYANGGSCIVGPDGHFIISPVTEKEALLVADISHENVRRERQNFDPSGHYARPDVMQLSINRTRQKIATFSDD